MWVNQKLCENLIFNNKPSKEILNVWIRNENFRNPKIASLHTWLRTYSQGNIIKWSNNGAIFVQLLYNYGAQHEHKYRQDIRSVKKTTWVRVGK